MVIRSSHKGFGESSILSTATNKETRMNIFDAGNPNWGNVVAPSMVQIYRHMSLVEHDINLAIYEGLVDMVGENEN